MLHLDSNCLRTTPLLRNLITLQWKDEIKCLHVNFAWLWVLFINFVKKCKKETRVLKFLWWKLIQVKVPNLECRKCVLTKELNDVGLLLLWTHFVSWNHIRRCAYSSWQAFFPGAHLCNGISAVIDDLYIHLLVSNIANPSCKLNLKVLMDPTQVYQSPRAFITMTCLVVIF